MDFTVFFIYYVLLLFFLFIFIESKLFQLVVEGGGGTFSSLRFLNGENISCDQFLWVECRTLVNA